MTQPKQTRHVETGSKEWVKSLSKCIDSVGFENFPQSLIEALKSLANFDHSVVFAYYQSEKPICLFDTFIPIERVIFVDDYLKRPYLLDPFFRASSRRIKAGLYRLRDIAPDRFYQSEYYRSYYIKTGLAEEICYTFYLPENVAVAISLMRSGEHTKFTTREFKLLDNTAPIVFALAQRHWKDVSEMFDVKSENDIIHEDHSSIESTVSKLFAKRITPRETQVVAQVLEGHSSYSIARNLEITVGTVRIHRRNIYAKLQISSQQELFSIFLNKFTALHE